MYKVLYAYSRVETYSAGFPMGFTMKILTPRKLDGVDPMVKNFSRGQVVGVLGLLVVLGVLVVLLALVLLPQY